MFGDNNGCEGKLVDNFECMGKDCRKNRLSSFVPCGSETRPEKYLTFNAAWQKSDQLRMLDKSKFSRHPIRCTHQVTFGVCAQKSGYNS